MVGEASEGFRGRALGFDGFQYRFDLGVFLGLARVFLDFGRILVGRICSGLARSTYCVWHCRVVSGERELMRPLRHGEIATGICREE